MAYGLKYYYDYKNSFNQNLRLTISKKNYVGSATELEGAADVFFTRYKDDGDFKFKDVRGSEADIFLNASVDFSLQEIYSSDEREFLVEHFTETVLDWRGFVIPDECSEPFAPVPYRVKIKSTDGLGTLKGLPYVDDDGKPYRAKQTWLEVLVNCLKKTDLNLPLSTCVNIYEISQPTGINDDPLTQTKIDPARYRDANGAPFSCYDVLKAVLNQFTAELKQANGRFNLTNVAEYSNATQRRRFYNSQGVFQSASEENTTRDVTHKGFVQLINKDHNTRKDKTYKQIEVYYQYGFYTSILLNGTFDGWDGSTFPSWTKNGALTLDQADFLADVRGVPTMVKREGAYITSSFSATAFLRSENVAVALGDTLEFSGRLVTFRGNVAKMKIKLGDYYLKKDGTWTKENTFIELEPDQPDRPVWYEMGAIWSITSAAAPVGGNAVLEIYGAVKGSYPTATGWVQYYSVELKKNQGNQATKTAKGEVYRLEQRGNYTYIPDRVLLLHGDALSASALVNGNRPDRVQSLIIASDRKTSNIYKADGVTITEKWNRYGKTDELPLAMIAARNILNNYQRPLFFFEGSFMAQGLNALQPFTINLLNGQKYVVLSGSFNYAKATASLVLVEVVGEDVVADSLIYSDFGGDTSGKNSISSPSGVSTGGVIGSASTRQNLQQVTDEGSATNRIINAAGVVAENSLGVPGAVPASPAAGRSYLWVGDPSGGDPVPSPGGAVLFQDIVDFNKVGLYSDGQLIRYSAISGKFENWTPDFITSAALSGLASEAWVNGRGFLTGITSGLVTSALGYTPYNADANAKGFLVPSSLDGYATQAWTNAQGFLTSYTESDTLDSVVARGDTTARNIAVNAKVSATHIDALVTFAAPVAAPSSPVGGKAYVWIGDPTGGSPTPPSLSVAFQDITDFLKVGSYSDGQLIRYNSTTGKFENWTPNFTVDLSAYYTKTELQNFFSGSVAMTGYNKTNWDAAYTNSHTHANKAFLDTVVSGATLALNITGQASNWLGYDGTAVASPGYLMGYNNSTGKFGVSTPAQVNTFLGMPSGGDTLASVTARGYTTTAGITVNGSVTAVGEWFRSASLTGIYNNSSATHFYSDEAGHYTLAGTSATAGGLKLKDTHAGTTKGRLYWNSSGIGLLSDTDNWGIRVNTGGGGSPGGQLYGSWNVSGNFTVTGNYYVSNYGQGLVGIYSATLYQGVFAMGDAYKLADGGTSPGSLYGLAWTHHNVGGQSIAGLSHQLLVMEAGVTKVALGTGIWTSGNITAAGGMYSNGYQVVYNSGTWGINISGQANNTMNFMSTSHNGSYWLVNNWTGTHWQITSNHGSPVRVGYADQAGNADTLAGYYVNNFIGKNGTSYYQPDTWIQLGGNYGLYYAPTGAQFEPNSLSSYTQWMIQGSKGGYGGIYDRYSGVSIGMYDASGNGGVYREANGLWMWYYSISNGCMGIGSSETTAGYKVRIAGSLRVIGQVYADSTGYFSGDVIAYYSDGRLKEGIKRIESPLQKVSRLNGVEYTANDLAISLGAAKDKRKQVGVIAQDFETVMPEVLEAAPFDMLNGLAGSSKSGKHYKTVKYERIVPLLIEAIKELTVRLELAERRLN